MRHVEVSRAMVFDAPRRARLFFEALVAPALRCGDARVQVLAGDLCTSVLTVTGITNKSPRVLTTGLLGGTACMSPRQNRYRLTGDGLRFAMF
jgi:hypothetical protein